jgi:hypothetical protein
MEEWNNGILEQWNNGGKKNDGPMKYMNAGNTVEMGRWGENGKKKYQ